MTILFKNRTTNGESPIEKSEGGRTSFCVVGTYDGAVIDIQVNQEQLGFITAFIFSATNEKPQNGWIASGVEIKAVLSGAGGSTDLSLSMLQ